MLWVNKTGSQIIAQDLIELLMSQILQLKTSEYEKENEINLNNQGFKEEKNGKKDILNKFIFASSEFPIEEWENSNQKIEENFIEQPISQDLVLNPRAILASYDFKSIMTLTNLVPFIKPGIPKLTLINTKKNNISKWNFKGKDRLFHDNLIIREGILTYNQKVKNNPERVQNRKESLKTPEKHSNIPIWSKRETLNISNNPEL